MPHVSSVALPVASHFHVEVTTDFLVWEHLCCLCFCCSVHVCMCLVLQSFHCLTCVLVLPFLLWFVLIEKGMVERLRVEN